MPRSSDAPLAILWRITSSRRRLYGGAVVALLIANLFAYLAPLVGSATLDVTRSMPRNVGIPPRADGGNYLRHGNNRSNAPLRLTRTAPLSIRDL
ncbi:MAG TPA: hypothetical protein VGA56_05730 [Opitutaceae bacterium]